jgi:aminoglycoside/choline kinase family phosphotransferase
METDPDARMPPRPDDLVAMPAKDEDPRREAAAAWAGAVLGAEGPVVLEPASADASFRRYFRLTTPAPARTLIVMDAPPAHEDCGPFVAVAALLEAAGIRAPRVIAQSEQGYLLLTDLGRDTLLDVLAGAGPDREERLYRDAIATLVRMQAIAARGLAPYDRALLSRELALFPDWYLDRHLGQPLAERDRASLEAVFVRIVDGSLAQPRVFVHRDYHSRNLMASPEGLGVLDFQDAVLGPVTYDLVSLLRDAYVDAEESVVIDRAIRYWEAAREAGIALPDDFGTFYRDFEWMGVQRHLKVMGIFARLAHRDGKHRYLADIPRVRRYLIAACSRYAELSPLLRWLDVEPVAGGLSFHRSVAS